MKKKRFNEEIVKMLDDFLEIQSRRFPENETLIIDLHCHDRNSDVPDEQLARILNIPETWLESEDLIRVLKTHGCDTYTVTNHNNARSCFELQEKGHDILVGAEFSCMVPDYKTGIHVLAYGFTSEHEKKLNKLRSDVYRFQDYTAENDIPTVWAHPLYHYKSSGLPPMEFFEKMSLLFERFEVINGQRDTWQNMLVKNWVESLTPARLRSYSKKFSISPERFCSDPYSKKMIGGSDSHMGIFTGLSGTRLHVPGLHERLPNTTRSKLALEALRKGDMAPYGSHNDSEKMAVAFLDYFCQIGINIEDPGLMRMLLHKGTPKEKMIAFTAANAFMELRRHKTTFKFLNIFHDCLSGKVPSPQKKFFVPKVYKEVFRLASDMAVIRRDRPDEALPVFDESIQNVFVQLNRILISRAEKKLSDIDRKNDLSSIKMEDLVSRFEIPAHFRELFADKKSGRSKSINGINISEFMDGLSFPFLSSAVILAAFFTSARVMYKSRPLLNEFACRQKMPKHPERTLWLTDTLEDSNGVAMVLNSMLHEIRKRDLPIDIVTASNTLESGENLIVFKPLGEYKLSFYEQQPLRIPNMLELHKLFKDGEYSRIVCSTEGPMGLAALYLKYAYSVPAHFYVHTDWMMFADRVLNFDEQNKSRLRRMLRAFYRGFDSLFVLNNDQRKWLTGKDMGFDPLKVFLTAHWADEGFNPKKTTKEKIFGVKKNDPVLLFAGRLSDEKGVMELPAIMEKVREVYPDVKIAFAGKGPKEQELKEAMPDAVYLGWVDHSRLPEIYSAADMLILPSRFDTFGCVVLEALSCGIPVIAYNTKGPKDIIKNGVNGYLTKSSSEITARIIEFLGSPKLQSSFKKESLKRASDYNADKILKQFMKDLGSAA